MQKQLWIATLFIIVALSELSPSACRADARCPWLNAATAEGLLGGKVQTNMTPLTAQGDTTCEFSSQQDSTASILRIEVHRMEAPSKEFASYLSKCGGITLPLKAIGNEAVPCALKGSSTPGEEQIIGRVRDRVFLLSIRRNVPPPPKDGLREDTRNIAEQIAGSLFLNNEILSSTKSKLNNQPPSLKHARLVDTVRIMKQPATATPETYLVLPDWGGPKYGHSNQYH